MSFTEIIAIVPAHNGENYIKQTVAALASQTVPIDILIVSDNSTDRTVAVVKDLQKQYPQLSLMETVNNKSKKSGALNQALKKLMSTEKNIKYVIIQDVDTIVEPGIVEAAMKEFANNPRLGAVCSRAGVQNHDPGLGLWNRLIWRLQKIEYGGFDSQRVETLDRIKVVHGMAAAYRLAALEDVVEYRRKKWNTQMAGI